MSRMEKHNSRYTLAYGLDHACGIFVQVFDSKRIDDDDEGIIVNRDEWTDPTLTIEGIVQIADHYGFDISYEAEKVIVYD